VAKDALDVLERKIQILEHKRFFETLPGRRRALDRLFPTIRAATDSLTRELYLSRVSEVAHVRKDVLEREVSGLGRREPVPSSAPGAGQPLPGMPANAERALVLTMLQGDAWRDRVLEKVDAEEIEHSVYRAVFDAVAEGRLEELDGAAARVYEQLRAEHLGEGEPDALFDRAVNGIDARRLDRELARLERELPLADEAEKSRLAMEKQRIAAERNRIRPTYKIVSRRSGAPGS